MKPYLSVILAALLVQCSPAPDDNASETSAPEKVAAPEQTASPEQPAESSAGELTFSKDKFTAKATPDQKEVTATFVGKNNTDKPITIERLETTCSCLSSEADPMVVPPGKETVITAVFEVARLAGNSEKKVIVRLADQELPQFLFVEVDVPQILEITPKMVEWSVGDPAEVKTVTFKVLRDEPIHITEIIPSTRTATVELKTIEEGKHYEILVKPDSTEASRTGMIRIQTDCELEQHQRQMAFYSVTPVVNDVTQ